MKKISRVFGNRNIIYKSIASGAALLLIALSFGVVTPKAQAQVGVSCYQFNSNLTLRNLGTDVVALQTFLESRGFLQMPPGISKGYFGLSTLSAVARYQVHKGIVPANGYVGPLTRAVLNADCTGSVPSSTKPVITMVRGKATDNFQAYAGEDLSIEGNYLAGNFISTTNVYLGGVKSTVKQASDSLLWVITPYLPSGTYNLIVSNEKGTSDPVRVAVVGNSTSTLLNSTSTLLNSTSTPPTQPAQYSLSVAKAGTGTGFVTGTGISCGTDCNELLGNGTNTTLTATPKSGSVFAGWSGACSGTSSICTVSMISSKWVTAVFNISTSTLLTSTSSSPTIGNITFIYPTASTNIQSNSLINVRWTSANLPSSATVAIHIIRPDNTSQLITYGMYATAGSQTISAPSVPGVYRIKITASGGIVVTSQPFIVHTPQAASSAPVIANIFEEIWRSVSEYYANGGR